MNDHVGVIGEALTWARAGRRVALATVVETWGSAPRRVGSRLAVDDNGHFIGSVSGGCVEGEILATAEEVLASGKPALRRFAVKDETAWTIGLACGGAIRILVEPFVETAFWQGVIERLREGETVATLVDLGSGRRRVAGSTSLLIARHDAVMIRDDGEMFLELWRPPLRLVLIGAVHIAQTLAPIASAAGYAVVIVDPREAFANAARFPGVDLRVGWPDEILSSALKLDSASALAALTHQPRIDDPALIAALRSEAFYIGALGSRGSARQRSDRLRPLGFSDAELARIHGPVGLAIGAANPAEIAISIAAELTAALRLDPSSRPEAVR